MDMFLFVLFVGSVLACPVIFICLVIDSRKQPTKSQAELNREKLAKKPESINVAPKARPKITYKENPASLHGRPRNYTYPNPKLKPQPQPKPKPKPKKNFVDKVFDGPHEYDVTSASIWKAGIRQESWRLINLGKLERKDKCENCGQPYPQMHHTSYEDATHIKWLCPACHKAWHREYGWPKAPKKVR